MITPDNLLQFVFRSGVSGNGATQLAEYNAGSWSNVGSWASASGTYTSTNGATSTARNLYIHGFTYGSGAAHVTGTWREQNGAVSCSSGGLTNHDTTYFYSQDEGISNTPVCIVLFSDQEFVLSLGRTWKNGAGTLIGTSGSNPIDVNTAGIIVDSLNADHGLMNQESQVVDSSGQIHVIISYVPGECFNVLHSLLYLTLDTFRPIHAMCHELRSKPNGIRETVPCVSSYQWHIYKDGNTFSD